MTPQESAKRAFTIRNVFVGPYSPDKAMANLGGFLANLIGPIPEEKWQQMIRESQKGCDDPGCDCGAVAGKVMDALDDLRTDWIAHKRSH